MHISYFSENAKFSYGFLHFKCSNENNDKPITRSITEYLRRKLDSEFGYIPGYKIDFIITNVKDKNKKAKCEIYKIDCSCHRSCIGETSRPFNVRNAEHISSVMKKDNVSAISCHLIKNPDYTPYFDSAILLEPEHVIFTDALMNLCTSRNLSN